MTEHEPSPPGPEQPVIVIEGLTKRYRARSERNFVPVPQLFRDRGRPGRGERIEPPMPDLELDDDDDAAIDELEEAEEREPVDDDRVEERPAGPVVALDDVSLSVTAGTALGILGPDGSGKSTLLRVITRLTPPSDGTVTVRGRIAPLIRTVPGLMLARDSLRRNVIQVATFYDLPRELAIARTDAVAEFAGVEGLLEQRVSSLSPGQQQRFAFAISLLLDPDILIADDVIAVGDKGFQRRCIDHIREQTSRGLTLLFASHRLDLVRELCDEAILLNNGRVVESGPIAQVLESYENLPIAARPPSAENGVGAAPSSVDLGPVRSARALSAAGRPVSALDPSEAGLIEVAIDVPEAPATIRCTLAFHGADSIARATQPTPFTASEPGRYVVSAHVAPGTLGDGVYKVDVAADDFAAEGPRRLGRLRNAFELEIYGTPDDAGDGPAGRPIEAASKRRLDLDWSVLGPEGSDTP